MLVCAAVVSRRHPACTEKEIQQRISKYIVESGDREGNRKHRPSQTPVHAADSDASDVEQ